jgi:hypothetical protein
LCSAAGLAEELADHFRLALAAGGAVCLQQRREAAFQVAVAGCVSGVRAQEVPQVDVITVRLAARHDDVEVVIDGVAGRLERLASRAATRDPAPNVTWLFPGRWSPQPAQSRITDCPVVV